MTDRLAVRKTYKLSLGGAFPRSESRRSYEVTTADGALLANAGRGLGKAFLDQHFDDARFVIDTNITGTVYLIQKVGRGMRQQGDGRILITGSIAGFIPGSFQAVYNGSKAFLDNFAFALRNELKDTGVGVTVLLLILAIGLAFLLPKEARPEDG